MLVSTLIGFNVKEEEGGGRGSNIKKTGGGKKMKVSQVQLKISFLAMRLFVP